MTAETERRLTPRVIAAVGDGYSVTVSSEKPFTGKQFCSVLEFVRAIGDGFKSRRDERDEAEMGV